MDNKDARNTPKNVAQGLNSPEIRLNDEIPYVDEFVELNHVKADEPIRPARLKAVEREDTEPLLPEGERKIHASDIGSFHSSPNSDTIVVNTTEGTLYITLEPDSSKPTSPISPRSTKSTQSTQSTDLTASPSTSKSFRTKESEDMIEQEKEIQEKMRANLRRNSISMPTLQNLEMEVMKQQYLDVPDEVGLSTD